MREPKIYQAHDRRGQYTVAWHTDEGRKRKVFSDGVQAELFRYESSAPAASLESGAAITAGDANSRGDDGFSPGTDHYSIQSARARGQPGQPDQYTLHHAERDRPEEVEWFLNLNALRF
jgi:hypothetical protein